MDHKFKVLETGCCLALTTVAEIDLAPWVGWLGNSIWTQNLQSVSLSSEHSIETQRQYMESEIALGRKWFVVRLQDSGRAIGVLSLVPAGENTCHFTILMGEIPLQNPLATIESIALLVKFGFESLHLRRIEGGVRASGFRNYLTRLLILGFIPEGLKSEDWKRENKIDDTLQFGTTQSIYERILKFRNGSYWLGVQEMQGLLSAYENLIRSGNVMGIDSFIAEMRGLQENYRMALKGIAF